MDLFEYMREQTKDDDAPLASRMRPRTLDEVVGQEHIVGKNEANQIHFEVGKKVRETIKDIGGTMPEDLPTPDKSILQIKKEYAKLEDSEMEI